MEVTIFIYAKGLTLMPKVTIRTEKCKGCGLCVFICPKKALAMSKELNVKGYHPAEFVDEEACISCAMCGMMCPDVAIKVEKE